MKILIITMPNPATLGGYAFCFNESNLDGLCNLPQTNGLIIHVLGEITLAVHDAIEAIQVNYPTVTVAKIDRVYNDAHRQELQTA